MTTLDMGLAERRIKAGLRGWGQPPAAVLPRARRRLFHASFWVNGLLACVYLAVASGAYGTVADYYDHTLVIHTAMNKRILDAEAHLLPADFIQINCLARNSYFEAATQGEIGMKAVDDVVYNRMKSGLFPNGVCQVIYEGPKDRNGRPLKNRCQFSWYCDGRQHVVSDKRRWSMAYEVAYNQYVYHSLMPDVTGGASYYHADYVHPAWRRLSKTVQIGAHLFYRPDPRKAVPKRRRRHLTK